MAGNLFSQKERPFRARWLSPSTSGKPDCSIYNHFFCTCQEKSEKNQNYVRSTGILIQTLE
jgi:hypothetical protein